MMRESWLPAKPESAARARAIVREASIEQGLDDDGVWSLMLATTEALSNAVLHGRPCSNGAKGILLRLLSWEDGLCVEVCDCGQFDAAPLPQPPAPDETRGRGMPIISAVVDHLELVTDGPFTRVRFAKRRRSLAGALGDARRGQASDG
jgi:anti-sigma regulatory factor (Ser/Thr protein kinase)